MKDIQEDFEDAQGVMGGRKQKKDRQEEFKDTK